MFLIGILFQFSDSLFWDALYTFYRYLQPQYKKTKLNQKPLQGHEGLSSPLGFINLEIVCLSWKPTPQSAPVTRCLTVVFSILLTEYWCHMEKRCWVTLTCQHGITAELVFVTSLPALKRSKRLLFLLPRAISTAQ